MTNTPPATIHLGDCIEVMRTLPENSVDAIVTDPPYGLGFMGKAWDELPPGEEWARECLRVLKPGGHLLAFGGSRTWHRLAVAVEDAGFEVRDSIAWLYGSGFPKSLDVSKAIDKRRDWALVERLSGEIKRARSASGLSLADMGEAMLRATDGTYGKWYHRGGHMFFETGRSLPSRPEWEFLSHVLPIAPEFVDVYDEAEREVIGKGAAGLGGGSNGAAHEGGFGVDYDITAPATDDARKWAGFGTALKPAFEPIVVARKPLTGTVAANVLAHGTGALNIDGCRVGSDVRTNAPASSLGNGVNMSGGRSRPDMAPTTAVGRWPANVVLDESQAAALDQMSGTLVSSGKPGTVNRVAAHHTDAMSGMLGMLGRPEVAYGDSGGASRFFYVAKAPTRERPKVAGIAHPTVKPLALMRWLVRLVTPPGGTVLEPFAGSGTTVEACALEGFACIAIEREPDYLPLIQARLARVEAAQPEPAGPSLFDIEATA